MSRNILAQTASLQSLLSLNMRNIDELFPGFTIGDFTVLYGSTSILSLTSLLCVRAQLPAQLGGLGSNVVFIDGGNTFRIYQITRLARLHQLDPKKTLKRIYLSRAFTAYQMIEIILGKLEQSVNRFDTKLVLISDIAGLFLDKDVTEKEARQVFSQSMAYLYNFAKENRTILIATYPPHQKSRRNNFLYALICARANSIIGLRQIKCKNEFILEKHSRYMSGIVEFPSENPKLTDFTEA